jgi:hypothetical protein
MDNLFDRKLARNRARASVWIRRSQISKKADEIRLCKRMAYLRRYKHYQYKHNLFGILAVAEGLHCFWI